MKRVWLLAVCCAFGCGPDAEELCEDLDECAEPLDYEDCVRDGERAEAAAERTGCEDLYDEYLDCLDADICSWRACTPERDRLESCGATLSSGAD
jgi:hypothetical protein